MESPERLHMCAFGHVPYSLELTTESALWPESSLAGEMVLEAVAFLPGIACRD